MPNLLPYHIAELTLEHALTIMQELTHWLVQSGIGYTEFSAALRPNKGSKCPETTGIKI